MMLALENEYWSELQTAYGSAKDIPELLRQLRSYPPSANFKSEPYFSLWSALCHQGDVYTASYAAVPHLIATLKAAPEKADWTIPHLAVCIELARLNKRGPKIPKLLEKPYLNSIDELPELIAKLHKDNPNSETISIAAAALAVGIGEGLYAKALLELTPEVSQEFLEWFFSR